MSFYVTAMRALDAKDFEYISELMHEDFIWMNGYDVKTWTNGFWDQNVSLKKISNAKTGNVYSKIKTYVHINIL